VYQRIYHDIANKMDFFIGYVFFGEVDHTGHFGDEVQIADAIGDEAVDFFGHAAIKAA
jgi:hypothetical protein